MDYMLLADVVMVLHALNVTYIIGGPILAWKIRWFRLLHLISLWWAFVIFAGGFYCPMTNFENALRFHYDPSTTYSTSFIVRYITPMVWWDLTQKQVVWAMMGWTFFWTAVYVYWWVREKTPKKQA